MTFEINNRRYTGSKNKLSTWIQQIINDNCDEKNTFADIFAGTGIVFCQLQPSLTLKYAMLLLSTI